MAERLKAPITVQLELTKNCNYLCGHCYNFWRYEQTGERNFKEPSDLENIDAIIDSVIKSEIFHVVLTGGEPLIKYDS